MGAFNEVCPQPVTFHGVVDKADVTCRLVRGKFRLMRGGPLCSTVELMSGSVPEAMRWEQILNPERKNPNQMELINNTFFLFVGRSVLLFQRPLAKCHHLT